VTVHSFYAIATQYVLAPKDLASAQPCAFLVELNLNSVYSTMKCYTVEHLNVFLACSRFYCSLRMVSKVKNLSTLLAMNQYKILRESMVETQIIGRSISDPNIISSMKTVPRHLFVSNEYQKEAYDDFPLPIGGGMCIPQPYMVALMLSLANLKSTDKVLEIGAGCGYTAAVLSRIVNSVFALEDTADLAIAARLRLESMDYTNVVVKTGDAEHGWFEHAPYDAIIVNKLKRFIPPTLKEHLAVGGRMIVPVMEQLGHAEDLVCTLRQAENAYATTTVPIDKTSI